MGLCVSWLYSSGLGLWNSANQAEFLTDFDYFVKRQPIVSEPAITLCVELPDQVHEAVAAHACLDCVEITIPLAGNVHVALAGVDGAVTALTLMGASCLNDVFALE
jgi:hypothetical protein